MYINECKRTPGLNIAVMARAEGRIYRIPEVRRLQFPQANNGDSE